VTVLAVGNTIPDRYVRSFGRSTTFVLSRQVADRAGSALLGRFVLSEPTSASRTPGCGCCVFRLDLVDSVMRAARRAVPPERIVVVVDLAAGDDLAAVAYTLLSDIDLARLTHLDELVTSLDGIAMATRRSCGLAPFESTVARAVAMADRIVLADRQALTAHAIADITGVVEEINLIGVVDESTTVIDAWHGAPQLHRSPVEHGMIEGTHTVVLRQSSPLDPTAAEDWLESTVAQHASRLLRLQGALAIDGTHERICCRGVRSFASSHSESEHISTRRSPESLVVLVGSGFDVNGLQESFHATRAV
jgi:G3E family GTPase